MSYVRKETLAEGVDLYLGDCREILPTLGPVDAVVTDPPYGIGERKGTISKQRNRNDYASFDDTPENVRSEIVPRFIEALVLSKRAVITPGPKCAFAYPEPVDVGMLYQPATSGMTHWGRCTCQPVFFYGKDPMSGRAIKPIHYQNTEAPEKSAHPCPKPLGATKWMVDRASVEGETILDPFMGSGTTGVAAVKLGRRFIGIEIEPVYFEIALARVAAALSAPDMFIATAKPLKQRAFL